MGDDNGNGEVLGPEDSLSELIKQAGPVMSAYGQNQKDVLQMQQDHQITMHDKQRDEIKRRDARTSRFFYTILGTFIVFMSVVLLYVDDRSFFIQTGRDVIMIAVGAIAGYGFGRASFKSND